MSENPRRRFQQPLEGTKIDGKQVRSPPAVREHGELGPVVTRSADEFRGPRDVPKTK